MAHKRVPTLDVLAFPPSSLSEPGAPFFTDVELARRWGMSPKTLRNARVSGSPIPFVRIGRLVRYSRETVLAYERKHTVNSTSE